MKTATYINNTNNQDIQSPDKLPQSLPLLQFFKELVRSNLISTITVTITGSLLLTGASTFNLWQIYQGFRSTVNRQFELQKNADDIIHLDEVLTMSAKMGAATGDLQWEKRYRQFEPKLNQVIQNTLSNVTPAIQTEAQKTDSANAKLIELENQAFAYIRQGKAPLALELLSSKTYEEQKQIYNEGNSKVLNQVQTLIDTKLKQYQQELSISIATSAAIFPILLASWLLVLSAVKDYIKSQKLAQESIEQSQQALLIVNDELKQEAEIRQKQEELIRQESEQLQEDIGELLDVVCTIEEGDLTIQAQVNDRATGLVGDTLNRLVEELGKILLQVSSTTQQVVFNSSQQNQIAGLVANQTEEQAKSLQQVLALTEMVRDAANNAAQQLANTNQSLSMLENAVDNGQINMNSLNQEIDILQQGSDRIVQQIKTLGEFVGLADQFVQDQSEIATQTQVLALNASLVAARAAEQRDPKQFSVVAREFESIANQISELAEQTNEGLNKLEQRNSQIHRVVSDVDSDIQRLGGLVVNFNQGVKQTREVFQTVQTVTNQALLSGEVVSQTSKNIVDASNSTVTAIESITTLSTQIASESQKARNIADQMNDLSEELIKKITVFKLPQEVGRH